MTEFPLELGARRTGVISVSIIFSWSQHIFHGPLLCANALLGIVVGHVKAFRSLSTNLASSWVWTMRRQTLFHSSCAEKTPERLPEGHCALLPTSFLLCEALLGSLPQPLKGKRVLSVPSAYLPSSLALRFPLSFLLLKREAGCCFWRRIQV